MKNIEITRSLYNEIVGWKMSLEPGAFETPVISYDELLNIPKEIKN